MMEFSKSKHVINFACKDVASCDAIVYVCIVCFVNLRVVQCC